MINDNHFEFGFTVNSSLNQESDMAYGLLDPNNPRSYNLIINIDQTIKNYISE